MYKKKLAIFAIIMASLLVATSALVAVSSYTTRANLTQNAIAQSLLQEHLLLSSVSYRLFKQLTDELIFGAGANQAEVRNKRKIIQASLLRITELETKQREALGEQVTKGSVEDTQALEQLLDSIITDFRAIIAQHNQGDLTKESRLQYLLEVTIDNQFREAINAAVNRQSTVVTYLDAKIEATNQSILIYSIILATLSVPVVIYGCYWLLGILYQPLQSIRMGAESVATGNYDYRIPSGFDKEFDDIATAFNTMAEALNQQKQQEKQYQQQLEFEVSQRTTDLTKANNQLRQNESARREFLADISHELRTPITIIRGESQVTLRQQADNDALRETLEIVLEQSLALSKLVDDLLFVARTESGNLRVSAAKHDIHEFAAELQKRSNAMVASKPIQIALNTHISVETAVFDDERISQVLLILLDNAIKHSPSNSQINVDVVSNDAALTFTVTDSGPGMDEQHIERIFQRYFSASDSRSGQGNGLGLAIAKAIVDAHQGTISATNVTPTGCRFTVELPAGTV